MAVASDGPEWGRNRNMMRPAARGDARDPAQPRSAVADYGRATMPVPPPQMPPMPQNAPYRDAPARESAASRFVQPPAQQAPVMPPRPTPAGQAYTPPYGEPAYAPSDYPQYRAAGDDPYVAEPQFAPEPAYAVEPPAGMPPQIAGRMAAITGGVTRWTRYAGAAASVALVLGVAWWSYDLLMRDVKGVPVVKAMEGPMRISPENPGGEVSTDTGFAINAIAALGTAAPPEDQLALAPMSGALTEEDLTVAVIPATGEEAPEAAAEADFSAFAAPPAPTAPAEQPVDPLLSIADAVAAEAPVVEEPAAEPAAEPVAEAQGAVATAPRPRPRPAALPTEPAAAPAVAPATVSGPLPSGTPLVQFGAYDSLELAASEWTRLQDRFAGLMAGKVRVVQEAASGGRTFFRLRATGFSDLADARRFCSAVVAEGAECIPTVEP